MTLYEVIFSEWQLVLFTLLAQAAMGLALVYTGLSYFKKIPENKFKNYLYTFTSCLGLALLIGVLHLSNPNPIALLNVLSRIYFDVNGDMYFGWLPLEIITLGITLVIGIVASWMAFKGKNDELVKKLSYLLPLGSFLGVVFMVNIYTSMGETALVWGDSTIVFSEFLFSSLFLGSFLAYAIFNDEKSKYIISLSYIGLMIVLVMHDGFVGALQISGIENIFALTYGYYNSIKIFGIIFTAIPVLILLYNWLINKKVELGLGLFSIILFSVFLGMVAFRVMFYALNNTQMFL